MKIDLLSTNGEVLQYHFIKETFRKELIKLVFQGNGVQLFKIEMDTEIVFFMTGKFEIIRYTNRDDQWKKGFKGFVHGIK
ncbi:hypothetical protein D3C73_792630 [compost metagenome]